MMTDDDKSAFVAALTELAALKPGAKLAKEAYAAWWNVMRQRWTLENFQRACAKLTLDVEFMPGPYHFEQLRKAGRPTAGEAWTVALECARHGGSTSGDELVDRVAKALGGYRSIGMSDTDKTQFLERRFCEHFDQMQDAQDVRMELPQIAGGGRGKLAGPVNVNGLLPLLGGNGPASGKGRQFPDRENGERS